MPLKGLRFISLVLILCLAADPVTASAFAPQPQQLSACPIKIPARWGAITDSSGFRVSGSEFKRNSSNSKLETRNSKLVVLIQDLHGNVGVQRNIAEIIKCLAREQSCPHPRHPYPSGSTLSRPLGGRGQVGPQGQTRVRASFLPVFVEGATGPFDVTILRNIADRALRQKIEDELMEKLLLTGSELAAVETKDPIHLWGVDDKGLYLKNLEAFYQTSQRRILTPSLSFSRRGSVLPLPNRERAGVRVGVSPRPPVAVSPIPHPKHPAWREYYRIAEERNVPLALNMLTHLEFLNRSGLQSPSRLVSPSIPLAVLVAGGYHTIGLTQLFKAQGISYVVVTPKVEQLGHEHRYVQEMRKLVESTPQDTVVLLLVFAVAAYHFFRPQEMKAIVQREIALTARSQGKDDAPSPFDPVPPDALFPSVGSGPEKEDLTTAYEILADILNRKGFMYREFLSKLYSTVQSSFDRLPRTQFSILYELSPRILGLDFRFRVWYLPVLAAFFLTELRRRAQAANVGSLRDYHTFLKSNESERHAIRLLLSDSLQGEERESLFLHPSGEGVKDLHKLISNWLEMKWEKNERRVDVSHPPNEAIRDPYSLAIFIGQSLHNLYNRLSSTERRQGLDFQTWLKQWDIHIGVLESYLINVFRLQRGVFNQLRYEDGKTFSPFKEYLRRRYFHSHEDGYQVIPRLRAWVHPIYVPSTGQAPRRSDTFERKLALDPQEIFKKIRASAEEGFKHKLQPKPPAPAAPADDSKSPGDAIQKGSGGPIGRVVTNLKVEPLGKQKKKPFGEGRLAGFVSVLNRE